MINPSQFEHLIAQDAQVLYRKLKAESKDGELDLSLSLISKEKGFTKAYLRSLLDFLQKTGAVRLYSYDAQTVVRFYD